MLHLLVFSNLIFFKILIIPPAARDSFLAMISALYAKVLVMMGLAFPMTEVISPTVSSTSSSYLVCFVI
jgi:hypothetical protein